MPCRRDGPARAGSSTPYWPGWLGTDSSGPDSRLPDLVGRIVAVHEMLDGLGVDHQFGGAIALAWYRDPRATTDVDLNITLAPSQAGPVLEALRRLGVTVTSADQEVIARDGQARLDWDGRYLDVFFATLDFHQRIADWCRSVPLASGEIPIMAPEHLVVCKAVFDRPKDWVDIDAIVSWGTPVDVVEVFRWVDRILGPDSSAHRRLAARLE
jgi:hypothetical protein